MTSNFLDRRSVKFLRQYNRDLDEILELFEDSETTKIDLDQKVATLRTAVEEEKLRLARRDNCSPESISYEPALDEALLYLEKYFDSESAGTAYSAIYDAKISIEYYLADIES